MNLAPQGVPQIWFEWWASVFDTDMYMLQRQRFGVTIIATATAGNTGNIQVPEPMYVFRLSSCAFVTASAVKPSVSYRIGFKQTNGNDWTSGQWLAEMVTGDIPLQTNGNNRVVLPDWDQPRELAQNDIVTVSVDNNIINSVGITVDAGLEGYVVRRRTIPIVRQRAA